MTGAGGKATTVRIAERLYRRASAVLPREFRERYGDELTECFGRIAGEARSRRGRAAVVSVTLRSIGDLLTRAPKQHLAAARAGALGAGSGWTAAWQDVRQAARRLRRRPSFTLASVLTLALGIAAATSVFSLVYGVVLSPLPYPQSDRLVLVSHSAKGLGIEGGLGVTYGFYRFYRERVREATVMAMYGGTDATLTGRGDPVQLRVARATPSLEAVLRVEPLLGRWFTATEGEPGAAAVAVLSHRLWVERFGADPAVLGSTIRLDGTPIDVVGVMPAGFAFPEAETALWLPRVVPASGIGGWNEQAVARLRPGATPQSLEAELARMLPVLREQSDDPARVKEYLDDAGIAPRIVTLKESVVADVRPMLWILLGTVGFVLLIAVANVANLFLVRAEDGQRESAVRTALGATRGRLARGFLAETLLLAGSAGLIGIGAASVAIRVLQGRAPIDVPRLAEVSLDPVVLTVALSACLVVALVLGLTPSLRRSADVAEMLKDGARRTTAGRSRLRGRNVLVATQVALALVLLIGSGLLLRTFQQLRSVDLGFSTRQALTFRIGLPQTRYATRADFLRFHQELRSKLQALPGVDAVGAVGNCLPLTPNMCWGETLEAQGFPTPAGTVPPVTGSRVTAPGYFAAMGIPVRGRGFTTADENGPARVAVLSEAAAAAYFPRVDALGQRVRIDTDGPWYTVVGIAANVRAKPSTDEFLRLIYEPMIPAEDGLSPRPLAYVLRTSLPPTSLVPAVRRTVAEVDPAVPLADVETLGERVADATAPATFALVLVGLAAAIALLLGAIGVYAVVAYAVSRRTAEIGVRIALGARAGHVLRLVMRQGGSVVLSGVAAGLAAALVLTRLMSGMLYGIAPTDPLSYAALTVLMLAVAGFALWLPAHRATRVDPQEALRNE